MHIWSYNVLVALSDKQMNFKTIFNLQYYLFHYTQYDNIKMHVI